MKICKKCIFKTLLKVICLMVILQSCQTEDVEVLNQSDNLTAQPQLTTLSTEPVPLRFSVAAELISEDNGCFTIQNTVYMHPSSGGKFPILIGICTFGPCTEIISSPGGGTDNKPAGQPPVASYMYKDEWIDDAVLDGTLGDFYDAHPETYTEYITLRDNLINP